MLCAGICTHTENLFCNTVASSIFVCSTNTSARPKPLWTALFYVKGPPKQAYHLIFWCVASGTSFSDLSSHKIKFRICRLCNYASICRDNSIRHSRNHCIRWAKLGHTVGLRMKVRWRCRTANFEPALEYKKLICNGTVLFSSKVGAYWCWWNRHGSLHKRAVL